MPASRTTSKPAPICQFVSLRVGVRLSGKTSGPLILRLNDKNLVIKQSKMRISKKLCCRLALCNIGCSKKGTKINQSIEVRTSRKGDLTFSLRQNYNTQLIQVVGNSTFPQIWLLSKKRRADGRDTSLQVWCLIITKLSAPCLSMGDDPCLSMGDDDFFYYFHQ